MFAEHFHDASVRGEMVVPRIRVRDPGAVSDLKRILPAIGVVLVRTEQSEVPRFHVKFHNIAKKPAHHAGRLCRCGTGRGYLYSVVAKIWKPEVAQEKAAISYLLRRLLIPPS